MFYGCFYLDIAFFFLIYGEEVVWLDDLNYQLQ